MEIGELAHVLRILVNTKLVVVAERFKERREVVSEIKAMHISTIFLGKTSKIRWSRPSESTILATILDDNKKKAESTRRTLHEVEVLRNEILAVIHDEDATNIQLDVVPLLLGRMERCRSH